MSRGKPPKSQETEQVRTSVSMTHGFWEETEKQMKDENYNNFSAYVQFLLKMRRELLKDRARETDRRGSESDSDTSLFKLNESKKLGPRTPQK